MIGVRLNARARRVLDVGTTEGAQVVADVVEHPYAAMRVEPPASDNSSADSSPRTTRTPYRLWWVSYLPTPLTAGDRVDVWSGPTLEVLAEPRPVMHGRREVGWQVAAQDVEVLYPRRADVLAQNAQDGPPAFADVPLVLYSQSENDQERGQYVDAFAEAPASEWDKLNDANLTLALADERWRIDTAVLARELPYVALTLRKVVR